MNKKLTLALALLVAGSGAALADHNSKWGEGTALDPTGIHDARIDSLDTAGDEPFASSVDAGEPVDILAAMRQERPDTIDIDQGGSVDTDSSGMGGGSESGGGNGGGGNGGGGRR